MSVIPFISKDVRKGIEVLKKHGDAGYVLLARDGDKVTYVTKADMNDLLVYTMSLMNTLDIESQVKAIKHISKVAMETAAKAMGEIEDDA